MSATMDPQRAAGNRVELAGYRAQLFGLDVEAEAQAVCMQTQDFRRAYAAFVAQSRPHFAGN